MVPLIIVGIIILLFGPYLQHVGSFAEPYFRRLGQYRYGVKTPVRPDPEPGGNGQRIRRPREGGFRANHPTARAMYGQPRSCSRAGSKRKRAGRRPEKTSRRRGKLSQAKSGPEFPRTPAGACQHRGPYPGGPAVL